MKQYHILMTAMVALVALAGCGKSEPPAEVETPLKSAAAPASAEGEGTSAETGAQTTLAPIALDPFTVDSLHIGELAKGHFNLYVKGGEPAAVRAWVGDEGATSAVVTKAEFEEDHHCAHIEVPNPLPADARLWVEIETAEGNRIKGSTAVQ